MQSVLSIRDNGVSKALAPGVCICIWAANFAADCSRRFGWLRGISLPKCLHTLRAICLGTGSQELIASVKRSSLNLRMSAHDCIVSLFSVGCIGLRATTLLF